MFPLIALLVPWEAARHGSVRNPLSWGENPLAFALFVADPARNEVAVLRP